MEMITTIDLHILLFTQNFLQYYFLTPIFILISSLGDHGSIWLVIIICLLLHNKTRKIGLYALLAYALCILITNGILKNVIGRGRPFDVHSEIIPLINRPTDYSFPSGHTAMAFTIALFLNNFFDNKKGRRMILLATLIAFSRLYLGVHFLSDIIAGFVVGWIIAKFVYWLYKQMVDCKK